MSMTDRICGYCGGIIAAGQNIVIGNNTNQRRDEYPGTSLDVKGTFSKANIAVYHGNIGQSGVSGKSCAQVAGATGN